MDIAYGDSKLFIEFPDNINIDIFAPGVADRRVDHTIFAERCLDTLQKINSEQSPPLIVVNDAYRDTPTSQVLTWIEQTLPGLLGDARFLIATGTHAKPTDKQLSKIFGSHLPTMTDRIIIHNAHDKKSMTEIGIDQFDQPVFVNSEFMKATNRLLISSVEPHYFAGFTGGRKSIFPGLTDLATIERNHNLANSLDAMPLIFEGNPVADHLMNMVALIPMEKMHGLQIVQDATGEIAHISCGRLHPSFTEATGVAHDIFVHKVDQPYDIIICETLPPLDKNLYQIQKSLENCQCGVVDGGTIILVSRCAEGIGSKPFYELARNWNRDTNRPKNGPLTFGSHKLSRVINHARRINIRVVSDLSDNEVRRVFYEPLDNLQKFLFIALKKSAAIRVAVVRDAGNTVLII